jgi:hypothetical protein
MRQSESKRHGRNWNLDIECFFAVILTGSLRLTGRLMIIEVTVTVFDIEDTSISSYQ